MILSYAKELLRACLRDKAILISLVFCQALLLLPMLASYPMTEEVVCRERAVEMLGITQDLLTGHGDELPQTLLESVERERQHYEEAAEADYPSKDYFAAMAAAKWEEDFQRRTGYSTGGIGYAANARLFEGLAALGEPKVYRTATELPAVEYLALAVGVMPSICVLLPALVAASRVTLRLRGRGFFGRAPLPLGRLARWAGASLACVTLALTGPAATVLPAALVAFARNGIGDPSYPFVHVIGGEVVAITAGRALLEHFTLLALAGVAIVLLMLLVSRARAATALATGLAVALLPLLPFYSLDSMPWASVGAWLPTSYLSLDQVIGHLTYANGGDITVFAGATFGRGATVLAGAVVGICLVTVVSGLTRGARRKSRLSEGVGAR